MPDLAVVILRSLHSDVQQPVTVPFEVMVDRGGDFIEAENLTAFLAVLTFVFVQMNDVRYSPIGACISHVIFLRHSVSGRMPAASQSERCDLAFHGNPLMTVADGLDAILIAAVILRKQADDPEIAVGHSTDTGASGFFDESNRLSNLVPMRFQVLTLLLPAQLCGTQLP